MKCYVIGLRPEEEDYDEIILSAKNRKEALVKARKIMKKNSDRYYDMMIEDIHEEIEYYSPIS